MVSGGYFEELKAIGPDALIISDPGVFYDRQRGLHRRSSVHVSTQANNTNYGTYRFWHELGAKRVVSARELSLEGASGDPGAIFRMIWRSRPLSTELCVFPIRDDAC